MGLKYEPSSEPLHISLHTLGQPARGLVGTSDRKVDVRLPGKGNSNSHGARPVHLILTMIQWIRTSRLSIKISLYVEVPLSREYGTHKTVKTLALR